MNVCCFGELLIDFTPVKINDKVLFEKNAGGAVANVAAGLSKLGIKASFIGKVGNDGFGVFLKDTLVKYGVDTTSLILDEKFNTTLAFVELDERGERSFTFVRKNGADTKIKFKEINLDVLRKAKLFHFGSLLMTDEPSLSTTFRLLKLAKKLKKIISFDPNLRELLWKDLSIAKERILLALKYCDILKVSEEELFFLAGIRDIKEAGKEIFKNYSLRILLVTLGDRGSFYMTDETSGFVNSFKVNAIDTTGAGDSFLAGFLYHYIKNYFRFDEGAMRFANACAALTVRERGAIPALPTLDEVTDFLQNNAPF